MNDSTFKRAKYACYSSYFTMSSAFCLPPLLFVTFHEIFGLSWTLLGSLILTNFCTQLAVDLIFTFFAKKFNPKIVVKVMPLITTLGLLIYCILPTVMPDYAYIGLLIGTFVFSVASGFSEVLLSPMIAAIPSDNPQKEMSKLHSLYAFGVFATVILSTLFLKIFQTKYWYILTLFFALLPLITSFLFFSAKIPQMVENQNSSPLKNSKNRIIAITLCALCIFLGSCAENVMSNWISSYMEIQLNVDKTVGDVLGVATFAILLGMTRIAYSKWGKNIVKTLFLGMVGASVCYLVAGLCPYSLPAFIACILTGVFTAMLWPGTLIMMEEKIPAVGVSAYALMASGGDLGAAFAPQMVGVIADASNLQTGILACALFPILGVVLLIVISKFFKKVNFEQ